MNKRKKILAVLLASSCMAIGTVAVIGGTKLGSSFATKANDINYAVELNASNGAVLEESLKTKSVVAKTNLTNDVTIDYKNMEVVAGKIGAIKAKGHYSLHDPVCAMDSIAIAGEAGVGDAVVKYGKTSACLDGSVDLALAIENGISEINANFFRIEAINRVVIESVEATYACSAADNGAYAENTTGQAIDPFFTVESNVGGVAALKRNSAITNAKKAIVPDFIGEGADFGKVVKLNHEGSYGFFEGASNLEAVYLPETIKEFGNYFFYTSNKIKEFTLPYALETTKSTAVPKGDLEVLNIHSKNLSSVSTTYINKSDHSKLHTINVSYDVEVLPSIISSLPETGVRLNYEGTEAEWKALTDAASSSMWKSTLLDVYCSDTTLSNVTLIFENATLDGEVDSAVFAAKNGSSFAVPGNPVYADNAKMFDGWYLLPNGAGEKVTSSFVVTEDVVLYANFIDWPEGSSINNAKTLVKDATNTGSVNPDAGISWFYTEYTASEEEVIRFNLTTTNSGYIYADPNIKVFDANKEEVDLGSHSVEAAVDIQDVGTFRETKYVKIHFNPNEKYYIAFANYSSYYKKYYTADFEVTLEQIDESNNYDYHFADDYSVGSTWTRTSVPGYHFVWSKFTAAETGTYIMNAGASDSGNWASYTVGHFVDGVWTVVKTLNASKDTISTASIDLVADEVYYVAAYNNASSGSYKLSYKISNELPEGYNAANAIDVTVDGEAVEVVYDTFSPIWHTFTIANEDYYIIHFDLINGKTSSPDIKVYAADATTTVTMTTVSASNDKYAKFTPGTYYFTATASDYIASAVSVSTMPEGYNVKKPADISVTSETVSLALEQTYAGGAAYRFVAPVSKFMIIKFVDEGTAPTLKMYKDGSTTPTSMSNKKLIYEVEADQAYILEVTSGTVGTTYNFSVEFADEIHDGASWATAFILNEGVESEVYPSATGVYATFTPTVSGEYVYRRFNSYSGTISCYEMNGTSAGSTVSSTSGATSYDKVYSLVAGQTYGFYDYYYYDSRSVMIFKKEAGYSKDVAIALDVDSETTSVVVENTMNPTFYSFTAPDSLYWKLTAGSADEFALLDSNGTELKSSVGGTLGCELTANSTYYIKVISEGSFTIGIDKLDPADVKDGSSRAKAIVWTPDEDGYMALGSLKSGMSSTSNCVWYELDVTEAGTYELWTNSTACDTKSLGVFAGDSETYIANTSKDDQTHTGKTSYKYDFYITFEAEVGVYYLALGTAYTVDSTAKLGFAKIEA